MSNLTSQGVSPDVTKSSELQVMLDTLYPHDCDDIAENYIPVYEPVVLDDFAVMYLGHRQDKGGKALIMYPGRIWLVVYGNLENRKGDLNVFRLNPFGNFGDSDALWLKIFFYHHRNSDKFDEEKIVELLKKAAGDPQ